MIAIVDYRMGNLRSVENALRRLGAEFCVTADADTIRSADRVLLPGVGNAAEAMENLRSAGLVHGIRRLRRPVLGICVGGGLGPRRGGGGVRGRGGGGGRGGRGGAARGVA